MEATEARLTEELWWDDYWRKTKLPVEAKRHPFKQHSVNEILAVMDRHLPNGPGLTALEIGGAPGQYLAYLVRRKGYVGHVLDYSKVGCAKSKENFALLGMPVSVHATDLFDDRLDIGRFDVVFSLGFIEHFIDTADVVGRHVRLLKPGGTLLIGCPNFRGINGWFLSRLAPELLAKHNTAMMDVRTWAEFERAHALQPVFRGYVGGFEPSVFSRSEQKTLSTLPLLAGARVMRVAFGSRVFKKVNAMAFSHYVMGVYRVPG